MRLEDMVFRTVQRNMLKKHGFSFRKVYFEYFFYFSIFFIALSSFFTERIDVFFTLVLLSQIFMAIPSLLMFLGFSGIYRDFGYIKFYIYAQKNQFLSLVFLSGFLYLLKPAHHVSQFIQGFTISCFDVVFTLSFISLFSVFIAKVRLRISQ